MAGANGDPLRSLPLEALELIDRLCQQFEASWASGATPDLRPYLAEAPDGGRDVLLKELLGVELEFRRGRGEVPTRADYDARLPDELGLLARVWREVGGCASTAVPMGGRSPVARGLPSSSWPVIPGYEIEGLLGHGGMGVVYKARHHRLDRVVALKLIAAGQHADPVHRLRFRTEARVIARLKHPNIGEIYEADECDGVPYLVLEYVDGGSLARKLGGEPQNAGGAAALVGTVARAVHAAHEEGIIHRDLKPANILLQANGTPKVTDFGLAKQLLDSPGSSTSGSLTKSGGIVGTPSYMAPEQAGVKGVEVGPAVDVYALGAILYELLTGRPPFRAETPLETVLQMLAEEPVPPGRLRPGLPRDLEVICLKCLEKDPRRRYASALALAEDLLRFGNGEPILARPIRPTARAWRWCRRNPALAGLTAALVLALAGGFCGVLVKWREANSLKAAVLVKQRDTERAYRDSRRFAATTVLERGIHLSEQGQVNQGLLWLAHGLELAPEDDSLRGAFRAVIGGWVSQVHGLRAVFPRGPPLRVAAFSPDGRAVLTAGDDGEARLWLLSEGPGTEVKGPVAARSLSLAVPRRARPALSLRHRAKVNGAAFSPDGRTLATCSDDGTARLWTAETGQPAGETMLHDGKVLTVRFSPDGRTLATAAEDGTARLWEAATGTPRAVPLRHEGAVRDAIFSPDGAILLTWGDAANALLWDLKTCRPVGEPLRHQSWVKIGAFSPDGHTVATGSFDHTAYLWDVPTGLPRGQPLPFGRSVRAVAFGPDGATLFTGGEGRVALLWDIRTSRSVGLPLHHQNSVAVVAFSPDGRTLLTASSDDSARLWEAGSGRPEGQPLWHRDDVRAVAFSPDGRTALTASRDGMARLWDASPVHPSCRSLGQRNTPVYSLSYSADGAKVLIGSSALQWYETSTDQRLGEISEGNRRSGASALSPDGRTILTSGGEGEAWLWDVATAQRRGPALKHVTPLSVMSVAFSPDGKTAVTGSGNNNWRDPRGEAQLWDVASGRPLIRFSKPKRDVTAVAFSPDGRTVAATARDRHFYLWDSRTGEPLCPPIEHPSWVTSVAFLPDGRSVVTGCDDGVARRWVVATGELAGELVHQGKKVSAVAVSPDGRFLVTGAGADATVQFWEATTGSPVGPPLENGGPVSALAVSPDGRWLITGGAEGIARRWPMPVAWEGPQDWIQTWVQVNAGRELDAGQRDVLLNPQAWEQRLQHLIAISSPPPP